MLGMPGTLTTHLVTKYYDYDDDNNEEEENERLATEARVKIKFDLPLGKRKGFFWSSVAKNNVKMNNPLIHHHKIIFSRVHVTFRK